MYKWKIFRLILSFLQVFPLPNFVVNIYIMTDEFEKLEQDANQIRNEEIHEANNAIRVGQLFLDFLNYLRDIFGTQTQEFNERLNNEASARINSDVGLREDIFLLKENQEAKIVQLGRDLTQLEFEVNGEPFTFHGYLNASGVYTPLASWLATDYVSVSEGQVWGVVADNSSSSAYSLCYYDINKIFIQSFKNDGIYTIPSGVAYIRACGKSAQKVGLKILTGLEQETIKTINTVNQQLSDRVADGTTPFYKYNGVPSFMFSDNTIGKYVAINLPMTPNAISAIKVRINQFSLTSKDNSLPKLEGTFYIYPSVTNKVNNYFAFIGNVNGFTDSNFECKIALKNNIPCLVFKAISNYSALIVDDVKTYYSYSGTSDKVTFDIINDLTGVEILQNITMSNLKSSLKMTDLTPSYIQQNMRYSAYPNINYTNWTNTQTGALCIKLPGEIGNNAQFSGFISFDVDVFRYTGAPDAPAKAILTVAGFITAAGFINRSVNLKVGNKSIYYNKVRIGYNGNDMYLILGDVVNTWQFTSAFISNISANGSSGATNDTVMNRWEISFKTDISTFTSITEINVVYDINAIPDIPADKIIGMGTKTYNMYAIPTKLKTYLSGMFDMIKNKSKQTPVNCLFIGNSITNFQNGWAPGANTTLPDVSNERPLCLYNTATFTNRVWELLNPGALDRAYRQLQYGGNMAFIKSTHPTKVVKNGTFQSNFDYSTSQYNSFGANGGHSSGVKEFLYTRNLGDYLEFTIPANAKGFSVVTNCFTGTKSADGTNQVGATTQMQVYWDGTLQAMETLAVANGTNKRFDYVINAPKTTETKVRVVNNEANKNMGLWGVEAWTNFCVRPINNGLAANQVNSFSGSTFDDWVKGANPDVIFFEVCILNDTRATVDATKAQYEIFFQKCKTNNYPVVVFVTHAGIENANITIFPNKSPDINDPNQVPRYYLQYQQMIIDLCTQLGIPYINVCQYELDKYNYNIPSDLFTDGLHLSYKGHQMYNDLIDFVFQNAY